MAAAKDYLPNDFIGDHDNDDDDDDDDSEGWSEMNVETESNLRCLFCPNIYKTMAVALEHCKEEHNFDLRALKRRFSMDCYSYFSLVNYVRRENITPQQIASLTSPVWLDNLQPAMPDDPWLMFDFDGLESPEVTTPVNPNIKFENGMVVIDEDSYAHMQGTLQNLRNLMQVQNEALFNAAVDMEAMRKATQNLVNTNEEDMGKSLGKLRITEDHGYFSSYSHFGIHHTMLTDKPRTISYRDAILKNAEAVAGKIVLDVGCGSAILSMFCAQAGAAQVIGVDQSDIIYNAMDIVRENGMDDKILLLKGRVEEIALPVEKVDIIVSEWMGYFLLFEGMLDAVILARDKFLRPGGLMLPSRCNMYLVGVSDSVSYQENIEFWDDVYGYKMTALRKEVLNEAYITGIPSNTVITAPVPILSLDLNTCTVESATFTSPFTLVFDRDGPLTAIAGYFDSLFELPNSVVLSTSPLSEKTHWRQTVFFLPRPLPVTQGSVISGVIKCSKKPDDPRALMVQLEIEGGNPNTYYLA